MSLPKYLTTRQAAEYLGISTYVVRKYITKGILKAERLGTSKRGQLRIKTADVKKLLVPATEAVQHER